MEQQKTEAEIEQLKKITRKDGAEKYAEAQFKLASIYYLYKKDLRQVIDHLLNIEKQDNPEIYAQAQLNLGNTYQYIYNNFEQAERYYLNVEKHDNLEVYASAQLNLGFIYQEAKHNIEMAEHYYSKVEKKDNPREYSVAQLHLGIIYQNKQDIEQAEHYYLNVKKQDNSELYAIAQFCLGSLYQYAKQNIDQAEIYYLNVEKQDNQKYYYHAQTRLGDNIYFTKTGDNLKQAAKYYQNVDNPYIAFNSYITAQLMLLIINKKIFLNFRDKEQRDKLIHPIFIIRLLALDIQMELYVPFHLTKSSEFKINQYEQQFAHYTKPEVLFNLLKNSSSYFRLNIVDLMNDPSENQFITKWLGIETDINSEFKCFSASFTFNYNSLNQFRLYGNENGVEGSGVSIVFKQDFFYNIMQPIDSNCFNFSKKSFDFKISQDFLSENKDKQSTLSPHLNLPLFRCLYFDPNSNYVSIAKRNKFSFYLDYENFSDEIDIDIIWKNYLALLDEDKKIKIIKEKLLKMKQIIYSVKKAKHLKIEKIINLDQLISLAVMPISCLIKHAGFENEDECRIVYFTTLADNMIVAPKEYGSFNNLFIDYGKIENYIEKIYLGPQCQPHHKLWITNHFRASKSKTSSNPIKVVQSEMPLR